MKQQGRTAKRLLMIIIADLLVLCLIEVGARVVMKYRPFKPIVINFDNVEFQENNFYQRDTRLFWRLKPGVHMQNQYDGSRGVKDGIRINGSGFRGNDITEDPEHGTIRVICMGDSMTFGWKVADDQTYPYILEEILRGQGRRPCPVEVINAGIPGYSTFQGARFLESDVLRFHPHIVLLAYGANDEWHALGAPDDLHAKTLLKELPSHAASPPVFRMALPVLLSDLLRPIKNLSPMKTPRVSASQTRANMLRMIASCRASGAEIMVISSSRHEIQEEACRSAGLEAFTLYPADFWENRKEWTFSPEDPHPSPAGQKVIAEHISGLPAFQTLLDGVCAKVR